MRNAAEQQHPDSKPFFLVINMQVGGAVTARAFVTPGQSRAPVAASGNRFHGLAAQAVECPARQSASRHRVYMLETTFHVRISLHPEGSTSSIRSIPYDLILPSSYLSLLLPLLSLSPCPQSAFSGPCRPTLLHGVLLGCLGPPVPRLAAGPLHRRRRDLPQLQIQAHPPHPPGALSCEAPYRCCPSP